MVFAAAARLAVAIASAIFTDGYLIPDEHLYVDLGTAVVHGKTPEQWYYGYGQSFYDSTWAFNAPLIFLFRIFGPERIVGQLFAVVAGAATAGVTVAIGLRFLRPAFAVVAGAIVALTPSQVLFSSVVLREGEVWLCLALVGLGALLMATGGWRRLLLGTLLAAAALLVLGYVRDQTMLAAAWCLPLALILTPWRGWVPRMALAIAIAVLLPYAGGTGWAGYNLASGRAPALAKTRATLAIGANSAFDKPKPPPAAAAPGKPGPAPSPSAQAAVAAATSEQSVRAGIGHLPVGLVDVVLRPFPWQSNQGLTLALAQVETLAWYVLYVFAALGIVVSVRRRVSRLALQFPVVLMGAIFCIAALTQGNLGTAYRHRDQVLWALALCVAAGLQWLIVDRRAGDLREVSTGEPGPGARPQPQAERQYA
jgi:hypothetical protein